MDTNLAIICGLTFVIHLIGTLAYAARIAGVRTGHIATALTLFNLLVLVSRMEPAFRVTCSNLSSIINGVATIVMYLLLDPQLSLLTD